MLRRDGQGQDTPTQPSNTHYGDNTPNGRSKDTPVQLKQHQLPNTQQNDTKYLGQKTWDSLSLHQDNPNKRQYTKANTNTIITTLKESHSKHYC